MTNTNTEAVEALIEPFKDYDGDIPDYDHPLRCVYESGIQYAVELLAKELGVEDYSPCEGTEEFDGDLGGTMMNIVCAALPKDADGDHMHPRDLAAALSPTAKTEPSAAGLMDEDEVRRLLRAVYDDLPHTAISPALSKATGVPLGEVIPFDTAIACGWDFCGYERTIRAILAALSAPTRERESDKAIERAAKYDELIYAVGNKYPGETRHETALRYIRQAEESKGGPGDALLNEGSGSE